MKNNPKVIPDLSDSEKAEVAQLYAAYEELNGCTTLDKYDKRGQTIAATLVIRRRVTKATTGFLTTASICAFVIAGATFGITTDKVADLRTTTADTLTTIKQCGEASAAKKTYPTITVELPPACTT